MSRKSELSKGIGKPKQLRDGTLRYQARLADSMLNSSRKSKANTEYAPLPTWGTPGRGVSGESSN